jgi:hypothetical protein
MNDDYRMSIFDAEAFGGDAPFIGQCGVAGLWFVAGSRGFFLGSGKSEQALRGNSFKLSMSFSKERIVCSARASLKIHIGAIATHLEAIEVYVLRGSRQVANRLSSENNDSILDSKDSTSCRSNLIGTTSRTAVSTVGCPKIGLHRLKVSLYELTPWISRAFSNQRSIPRTIRKWCRLAGVKRVNRTPSDTPRQLTCWRMAPILE